MPVCPRCHHVFDSSIPACPTCGRPVSGRPSQDAPPADIPLVPVAGFASEALARMWAEVLERHGVGVVLKTAGVNIGGVLSAPLDDYRLLVLRSHVRRARRVLGSVPDLHPPDYDYRI